MRRDLLVTWDELEDSDLPLVCYRCGADAEEFIKVNIVADLGFVDQCAKVYLPLCEEHSEDKRMFGHHDVVTRYMTDRGVVFKNACEGFLDAIEDYRDSPKRFRREERQRLDDGEYDKYRYGTSKVGFFDEQGIRPIYVVILIVLIGSMVVCGVGGVLLRGAK